MTQPALLALASANEHPLLDIDATAFIQFAIFVVLALVSTRFLFRPYLRMREDREAGMDGARAEAANLSAEADAKLADYESTLAKARLRAQTERRAIRAKATEYQAEVTNNARVASQEALDAAHTKVQTEAKAAREELMPKAEHLAAEIVTRLLARKAN